MILSPPLKACRDKLFLFLLGFFLCFFLGFLFLAGATATILNPAFQQLSLQPPGELFSQLTAQLI